MYTLSRTTKKGFIYVSMVRNQALGRVLLEIFICTKFTT